MARCRGCGGEFVARREYHRECVLREGRRGVGAVVRDQGRMDALGNTLQERGGSYGLSGL